MTFLNATFLFGLPLAFLPVVIHLLNRRRREVVRWGAMQFLMEAVTRRRRRWRLDDWLLMALRAAAVLAIVLALAQPRIKAGWFGVTGPRDVIVVLDNSMSTSLTMQSKPVFDRLIAGAEQLINGLSESDYVRVLMAAELTEWLQHDPVLAGADAKRRLVAQIRDLSPTQSGNDMSRCLQRALEAESANPRAPRIIMVMTDGQAQGWRSEATSSWRAVKLQAEKLPTGCAIQVWNGADQIETVNNLTIESVTPARGAVSVGERFSVAVTIKNTGNTRHGAASVRILEADRELASADVPALGAGESTQVELGSSFDQPDVHLTNIEINRADDLVMDNSAAVVIETLEHVPILVVEGTHHAEGLRSDAGYFLAALGQLPTQEDTASRGVFRPTTVTEFEVTPQQIRQARCIVLADVSSLPLEASAALVEHVRRGAGLWIALGEQIKPTYFNQVLYADGQGLAGLALNDMQGDAAQRDPIALIPPPDAAHPATRLLADTQRLDINRVQIFQRHRFVENKQKSATSLLLSTDRGEPLVVERAFGRGRTIVQAVPLNAHWSNWPLCQAFVVMTHEWLWYLTEPSLPTRQLAAGETMNATVSADQFSEWAEVIAPSGKSFKVASQLRDEQRIFTTAKTWWPGVYQMVLADHSAHRFSRPFVVQRDRRESELAYLSQADHQALTSVGGLHFEPQPIPAGHEQKQSSYSQPAWTWFLLGLLALMLIELLMSGRLTRGRLDRSGDLTIAAG